MAIVGDGRNETQPIEIADLVDGLLRCASTEGAAGQIYHFAGPRPISIEELLREIAVAVGVPPPCLRIPMSAAVAAAGFFEWVYPRALGRPPIDRGRLEFFRVWHAYSLEKSRRELGWQPATEFPEGAQRVARELRARRMLT